jgi:hypothetical protein
MSGMLTPSPADYARTCSSVLDGLPGTNLLGRNSVSPKMHVTSFSPALHPVADFPRALSWRAFRAAATAAPYPIPA